MRKVEVYITATVVGTITVSDNITDEDIKNGIVDIYFHPKGSSPIDKEDLGADNYTIDIIPEGQDVNPNQLKLDI